MPQRYAVRVRVEVEPEAVQRVVGHWGTVTEVDGAAVLEMNVDSLEWPVMVLAQVGAPFGDVEPPELRDMLARTADLFSAATAR